MGRWLLSMLLLFGAILFMWLVFWMQLPPEADWIFMFCVLAAVWLLIVLWVNSPHGHARPDDQND